MYIAASNKFNGLNPDAERRDKLIFGTYDLAAYSGGCRCFEDMSLATLEQLIDEGFVDIADGQNLSPSIQEFVQYAKQYGDSYVFDGYVVSPERGDYRVSIDAISRLAPIEDEIEKEDFADFCQDADDFDGENGYAWWD